MIRHIARVCRDGILIILALFPALASAQSNEVKLSQFIATLNSCSTATQFVGKDLACHSGLPGTVTSITGGTGLTGGTITTTGTLAVDQAFSPTWTGGHIFQGPLTAAQSAGNLTINSTTATNAAGTFLQLGAASKARVVVEGTAGATVTGSSVGDLILFTNGGNIDLAANGGSSVPVKLNSSGNVTINAPSSGDTLVVNGVASNRAAFFQNQAATGTSQGVLIFAGTNSSDFALAVDSKGGTPYFLARGDGVIQFPAISTTASAANAFIDNANSNNLLRSTSSIRYKQDVHPLDVAEEVLKLRPIRYRSKAAADDPKLWWYGLIAEEVAKVDPRLIFTDKQGRPDGVQYDRIGVLTLGVVQHQQRQIEWLWAMVGLLAIWNTYLTFRRRV